MSFDVTTGTIVVNDVVYNIDDSTDNNGSTTYTVELGGEQIFEGLTGRVGWDEDSSYANPRRNTDCNLGAMFVNYSGYDLGDDDLDVTEDFMAVCSTCEGMGVSQDRFVLTRDSRLWIQRYWRWY